MVNLEKAYLRNGGLGLSALIIGFSELPLTYLFSSLDQVNPPRNITVELEETSLYIQWEKPVSAFPVHCFNYELKIHNTKNGYFQVILKIIPLFYVRHPLFVKHLKQLLSVFLML